jgi:hypothetical protein
MTALATTTDVETRLGRSLTESETAKAEALLDDASALVVGYTGQQFLPGESFNLLQVKQGNKIRLTQRPATDVIAITTTDGDDVVWTWDGFQTVTIDSVSTCNGDRLVVNYEHGNATVPQDVVAIVASMVARTISIPTEAAAGVTQQSVGPFSVTYANWAVGGQVMMSPAEQITLNRYRTNMQGTIETLG